MDNELINQLLAKLNTKNIRQVKKAINFAKNYHSNQFRLTGEKFICHPLNVAINVCDYTQCQDTIISAILHDVIEDTDAAFSKIYDAFGQNVALIVDALTKNIKLKASTIKYVIEQWFCDIDDIVKVHFKKVFYLDNNKILLYSNAYELLKECAKSFETQCQKHGITKLYS